MAGKQLSNKHNPPSYGGVGAAIGIGVGTAIGVALGEMEVWLAVGAGVGTAIGLAFPRKPRRDSAPTHS